MLSLFEILDKVDGSFCLVCYHLRLFGLLALLSTLLSLALEWELGLTRAHPPSQHELLPRTYRCWLHKLVLVQYSVHLGYQLFALSNRIMFFFKIKIALSDRVFDPLSEIFHGF